VTILAVATRQPLNGKSPCPWRQGQVDLSAATLVATVSFGPLIATIGANFPPNRMAAKANSRRTAEIPFAPRSSRPSRDEGYKGEERYETSPDDEGADPAHRWRQGLEEAQGTVKGPTNTNCQRVVGVVVIRRSRHAERRSQER